MTTRREPPFYKGDRVIFHRKNNPLTLREEIDPILMIPINTQGSIQISRLRRSGALSLLFRIPNPDSERGWGLIWCYQDPAFVGCHYECRSCPQECGLAGIERLPRFARLAERLPFSETHTWGGSIDPFLYISKEEADRLSEIWPLEI